MYSKFVFVKPHNLPVTAVHLRSESKFMIVIGMIHRQRINPFTGISANSALIEQTRTRKEIADNIYGVDLVMRASKRIPQQFHGIFLPVKHPSKTNLYIIIFTGNSLVKFLGPATRLSHSLALLGKTHVFFTKISIQLLNHS